MFSSGLEQVDYDDEKICRKRIVILTDTDAFPTPNIHGYP